MLNVMAYFGNTMENNMATREEISTLINKFENAVISAWVYDTKLEFDENYNPSKLNKADLLYEEAKKAKQALADAVENLFKEADELQTNCIEQMQLSIKLNSENKALREQSAEDSWSKYPDRSGGQFTQQEIDESRRGGHGW